MPKRNPLALPVTQVALSRRLLAAGLVTLVLLGSWLRLHHLGRASLWSDELFTLAIALHHPLVPEAGQPWYRAITVTEIGDGDTFLTAKAGEQSPPLFDLLSKASVQLLGPTEVAARLPSAVAACLLLLCCAWLAWRARDAWARRVLCWTLLLLAFYPVLVIYAKDARAYSLGASLLGVGALQWLLRWRDGWRQWRAPGWAEALALSLACLTHYNAIAMVAMLVLPDVVMACKTRSRQAWWRFAAMAIIVLPWLVLSARTILFTARGGAGWGPRTGWQFALATLEGSVAILHPAWLVACGLLLVGLAGYRLGRRHALPGSVGRLLDAPHVVAAGVLTTMMTLHVATAGKMAASAGMVNPRYYIFMIPLAAVLLAVVLAELRPRWAQAIAALAVVLLAAPWLRTTWWMPNEDFRSMARFVAQDAPPEVPVLFPWQPNRDTYRIYLDRMLGIDNRARMVAVSTPQEVPAVCQRLSGQRHVAALGHASGRERINEVYAACGQRWPHRFVQQYQATFAEQWYADPPVKVPQR